MLLLGSWAATAAIGEVDVHKAGKTTLARVSHPGGTVAWMAGGLRKRVRQENEG